MAYKQAHDRVGKEPASWWQYFGLGLITVGATTAMIVASDYVGERIGRGTPVFAMWVAMTYAFCGAMLLLGGASPRLGTVILEVQDIDEIREQRALFVVSGLLLLAIGVFLGALTLGYGNGRVLSSAVASGLAIVAALVAIVVNAITYRMIDELILSITKDATLLAASAMLLIYGGWAAAAILGAATMFSPLLGLSGFFAIYLASCCIIWYRRGLLV